MITERENVLRAITGKGKPEWAPVANDCLYFCIPSAILERPKFEDGPDWFGCQWKFFPETFGYAEVFGDDLELRQVALYAPEKAEARRLFPFADLGGPRAGLDRVVVGKADEVVEPDHVVQFLRGL